MFTCSTHPILRISAIHNNNNKQNLLLHFHCHFLSFHKNFSISTWTNNLTLLVVLFSAFHPRPRPSIHITTPHTFIYCTVNIFMHYAQKICYLCAFPHNANAPAIPVLCILMYVQPYNIHVHAESKRKEEFSFISQLQPISKYSSWQVYWRMVDAERKWIRGCIDGEASKICKCIQILTS